MKTAHDNLWNKITEKLKSQFPPETFKLWFSPTRMASFEDGLLVLEVPNQYFSDWMEKNRSNILGALKEITDTENPDLDFIINPPELSYASDVDNNIPDPTYQPQDKIEFPKSDLNPRYTFESFIVGPSNRFAQAVAEAVSNEPGVQYNPLFIYSGVGLGKTHLLHSIGHRIKSNFPQKKVLYITCEKFTQEMIDSLQNKKMLDFNRKYHNIFTLLMDDIQFLEGKNTTQDVFFHIFNNLYESHIQVVFTSDKPPSKLTTLEERLSSRFQWGVTTDIQPPDLETRIAILQSKAEREDLEVPGDVLLFIAKNIKDNIRKLEGALIRIYAFSSLTGSEVTVDNSKEILKDMISEDKEHFTVTIDNIQKIIAEHYHIQLKELVGRKRHSNIVFPRHLAMYLSRKLTENSTTEIGSKFGGRDHTTVMYGCKVINKKLEDDPYFEKILNKLVNKIKIMN